MIKESDLQFLIVANEDFSSEELAEITRLFAVHFSIDINTDLAAFAAPNVLAFCIYASHYKDKSIADFCTEIHDSSPDNIQVVTAIDIREVRNGQPAFFKSEYTKMSALIDEVCRYTRAMVDNYTKAYADFVQQFRA